MTPTEKARRSDALYFDTKVTSRRALCDMVANSESDLEESKSENERLVIKLNAEHIARQKAEIENAKLRDELTKWERLAADIDLPEYPVTQFEPKDLERENSELRELCADMVKMLVLACWDSVESDEEASQCIYRAEALGIEVGE